mgnify:CR=1 FL=1
MTLSESITADKAVLIATPPETHLDLAKLSHGLLSGEELTNFIKRSFDIIK